MLEQSPAIILVYRGVKGPPLEYLGGGAGVFLEINIFVGKMGDIYKCHKA